MFWLRNEKKNFQLHTLIWRPAFICYFDIVAILCDLTFSFELIPNFVKIEISLLSRNKPSVKVVKLFSCSTHRSM